MESSAPSATSRAAGNKEPARRPLIALSVFAAIAATTGTMMYAYPETLASIQPAMVLIHDLSGDGMLIAAIVYLVIHLRRTWRMKKLLVSRYTGLTIGALLAVTGITGIYGQFIDMPSRSPISLLHGVAAIATIALACFHGAHGLRRKL